MDMKDEFSIQAINKISSWLKLDQEMVYKHLDSSLFHKPFDLKPEDLLYLYFCLKTDYPIVSNKQKEIVEGGLGTIRKVINIIAHK